MSTILLRRILEAGLCGLYVPKQKSPSMGEIHYGLDMIIADSKLDDGLIQLANHINLRYEDQLYFQKCVLGLRPQSGVFHLEDVKRYPFDINYWADTNIKGMVLKDGPVYIEPCYNFYVPDKFVPLHSIIAAYLMGERGKIRVDVISALGGADDGLILEVPINEERIAAYLAVITGYGALPGGACLNCAQTCEFKDEFEKKVYDWMKAQQHVDGLEAQLREHLTYRGPTKCGSHLVYMKESTRRTFDSSKSMAAYIDDLKTEKPINWSDFLKPDAAEIAKAIKNKSLPARFLTQYFKFSSSFSIDTMLSL